MTQTATDRPEHEPYPVPNPEWTPRQEDNWAEHMAPVYDELETDVGREWYRRCWRPKKRNGGKLERDHVQFGTPEDYVVSHVEDHFDPWGSMMGVMMRELSRYDVDTDVLDRAVDDIVRAKLRVMADEDPDRARRLVRDTEKVASLYGVSES